MTSNSCEFGYLASNDGMTEFFWSKVIPEDPPLLPADQPKLPRELQQAHPAKDGVAPYIVQHSQGTRWALCCKKATQEQEELGKPVSARSALESLDAGSSSSAPGSHLQS